MKLNNTPAFLLVFSVVAVLLTTTAFAQSDSPPKKTEITESSLGATKNVHKLDNLFFAGQFTKDDLDTIKSAKIQRVISLRTKGEVDWDEKGIVEAEGMEYVEIPFRKPESLNDEVFGKVRKALRDKSKTTLFHCGSANRVGGVWLTHRVLDQGVDLETAMAEAKTIGMKAPFIEAKALDYIKRMQKAGKEESVKPGINKGFVDPNLDVEDFVKRFEIESREVYLNREAILEATGVKAGDVVADVGAGTGLFTRLFSKRVGDDGWVYAVDISPRFLEHINAESNKQNLTNITGVLCAEDSVNLPPNSVDVIFVCDTYHHFEFPNSTLAAMKKALKKGGRLVVIDFDRIEGKSRPWLLGHVRAGKEVFRAEIQDAGFSLVEEKKMQAFEENYFLIFRKDAK